MTLNDLRPDVAYVRGREREFLKQYTDDQLRELELSTVQKEMKLDLATALNMDLRDPEEMATLDDLITQHEERCQLAMSLLQLWVIYRGNQFGPVAKLNADKEKMYSAEYARHRRGFAGLRLKKGSRQVFIITARK